MSSTLIAAPGPPAVGRLPSVELQSRDSLEGVRQRLTLQPHLPGPGYFGSINVTGRMLEWSYPRTETASQNTVSQMSESMPYVLEQGKQKRGVGVS